MGVSTTLKSTRSMTVIDWKKVWKKQDMWYWAESRKRCNKGLDFQPTMEDAKKNVEKLVEKELARVKFV